MDSPVQLGSTLNLDLHQRAWARADDITRVLLTSTRQVLSAGGGGRAYRGARKGSQASVPGAPPAMQSGAFVQSFVPFIEEVATESGFKIRAGVESIGLPYAGQFDPKFSGYTRKPHFAPRPFVEAVMDLSGSQIEAINREPLLR